MSDCVEFYAWVKTVSDERSAPQLSDCEVGLKSCCTEAMFTSGDRPPFAAAAMKKAGTAVGKQCVPPPHECCDAHHQRLCTPPAVYGEWRVDSTYVGQKHKSFEVLQFIGGRDEAIAWFRSSEGTAWRCNALNVALLKFSPPDAIRALVDPGVPVGTKVYEAFVKAREGQKKFSKDSWRCDYLHIAIWGDDEPNRWLDLTKFAKLLSIDESDFLALAGVLPAVDEREAMLAATRSVSRRRRREIRAQASDIAALRAVVRPNDQLLDKPATMALLDRLRRELRFPIMRLKLAGGHQRPWDVLPDLPLVIKAGEPLFPAHAAMPAGHAVLVHALTTLLIKVMPGREARYRRRADRICDNRIVAGLHWPLDIAVGKLVGELFAEELWKLGRMKDLLALVRAELA